MTYSQPRGKPSVDLAIVITFSGAALAVAAAVTIVGLTESDRVLALGGLGAVLVSALSAANYYRKWSVSGPGVTATGGESILSMARLSAASMDRAIRNADAPEGTKRRLQEEFAGGAVLFAAPSASTEEAAPDSPADESDEQMLVKHASRAVSKRRITDAHRLLYGPRQ